MTISWKSPFTNCKWHDYRMQALYLTWLLTGNVRGLMDDGNGMASTLALHCAEETGAIEVLNIHRLLTLLQCVPPQSPGCTPCRRCAIMDMPLILGCDIHIDPLSSGSDISYYWSLQQTVAVAEGNLTDTNCPLHALRNELISKVQHCIPPHCALQWVAENLIHHGVATVLWSPGSFDNGHHFHLVASPWKLQPSWGTKVAKGTYALTLLHHFWSPGSSIGFLSALCTVMTVALAVGDVTAWKLLLTKYGFAVNAAWALAAICMSKQVIFFVGTTCKKLMQTMTTGTNTGDFRQWS